MGSADSRGKKDEKLKSKNMIQKQQFSEYFDSNQGRQV